MKIKSIDLLMKRKINDNIIMGEKNYVFYNFLEYIKEKYDFRVTDLSLLFNCTRQTLYNYFGLSSNKLNQNIKDIIAEIYNVNSFQEAIEVEFNILHLEQYKSEIEKKFKKNGTLKSVPSNIKKYFDISFKDDFLKIKIKDKFLSVHSWYNAIENKKKIQNIYSKSTFINNLLLYLSYNDEKYNEKLIEMVTKLKNNDKDFLITLKNYLENNSQSGIYGIFIKDKNKIKKEIKNILKCQNSIISLDEEDFNITPKYYLGYSISRVEDFKPKLDIYNLDNHNHMILNITSGQHISLYEMNIIVQEIGNHFKQDFNITFGTCIDNDLKFIKVELFFII